MVLINKFDYNNNKSIGNYIKNNTDSNTNNNMKNNTNNNTNNNKYIKKNNYNLGNQNKQNISRYNSNNYPNNPNNLNDETNIKSFILDYLYNSIEVGEYKYTIIKNISDIYDLKFKKYYLSVNSCGISGVMIFIKKDNKFLSYLIDRRSISYNRQSLNKSNVRITEIKLNVDLKLYDGTILDGIIIDSHSNIIGNENISQNKINFLVTDVFYLGGKSLITIDYKKKMYMCELMFDKIISNNDDSNNIELSISRPYEMNEIKELFTNDVADGIKKLNIKGISFYPQYSGNKLIYIFDKQDDRYKNEMIQGKVQFNVIEGDRDVNETAQDNFEYSDKKRIFKFELVDPECTQDIILNLQMVKTMTPDVYKLYGIFSGIKNDEKIFIKKNIGHAYIPTFALSIKCKLYFMNRESIIMSCLFNTNKNKWIPIEEAKVKKIDILNNEKRLKIIEQEIDIDDNDYQTNEFHSNTEE